MKCRFCGGYYSIQIIGRHEEICPKNPSTGSTRVLTTTSSKEVGSTETGSIKNPASFDDTLTERVLGLERYIKEMDDRLNERTNQAKAFAEIAREELTNEFRQKFVEVQQEIRNAHSKIDNLQRLVQTYLGGQLELASTLRKARASEPIQQETAESGDKQSAEEEMLAIVPERFKKPYLAITKVLAANPDKPFTVAELAQRANYRPKGGSFRQTMALIKRNKIVLISKDTRKNLTTVTLNPDVKNKIIQVAAAEQIRSAVAASQ
jgi:hypothetical protein